MSLPDWQKNGWLTAHKSGANEVRDLLGVLDRDLKDSAVDDISTDARLAARYFQVLCKTQAGRLKPGERARWIPNSGSFRYYRHLLAGPYLIVGTHADDTKRALAVLSGHVSEPGDIAEQMVSRQEIVTNPHLMEAITKLYIDSTTLKPKRGAASKTRGGARRLATLIDQLDLTWDVYGISADSFLELLPQEFDKFLDV